MINNIPRHIAIFPISSVEEMTKLSARQIRYCEEHGLITPVRNEANQRIFSLEDIERFLEIKQLMDLGINIAGIKEILSSRERNKEEVNKVNLQQHNFAEKEWQKILSIVQMKVDSFKKRSKS